MNLKRLRIVAPDRIEHGPQLFDLLAKVFAGPSEDYFDLVGSCQTVMGDESSHLDWDASRIATIDEKLIANFSVWDYLMRVGKARLRVGGIGCVATHGEFRKQGVMSKTIEAAKEAMRRAGYDVTILFGIPDFYQRYGYVRAWSDQVLWAKVSELQSVKLPSALRRFSLENNPEADALYNKTHANFTGTAIRPTYRHSFVQVSKAYRWLDQKKNLAGYIRANDKFKPGVLTCLEAVGATEEIQSAVALLAGRLNCREVRFTTIPPRHPLLVTLKRGNCRVETSYHRSGEAMIHSLNTRQALSRMTGELSARLRKSAYDNWRGKLDISDGSDRITLKIERSAVSIMPRGKRSTTNGALAGGDYIAQLLIGTDDPLETAEWGRIKLAGEARKLLQVLFPKQQPALCGWDRY